MRAGCHCAATPLFNNFCGLGLSLKADGSADKTEGFADGWLNPQTRHYSGRPVDVANLPDGSILVSNDFAGAIYRISYTGQ